MRCPLIFDLARRGWRVFAPAPALVRKLEEVIAGIPNAVFLQIGANDGISNDVARELVVKFRMKGVMVEPLPFLFRRLQKNYRYLKDVRLVQCAVSYQESNLVMYHLSESFLAQHPEGESLSGLASSNREHIVRHFPETMPQNLPIEKTTVECMTAEQLLDSSGYQRFDIVFIDVEGMDADLIKGMSLSELGVKALVYETAHLGAHSGGLDEYLDLKGYRVMHFGDDALAISKNLNSAK